MFPVLWCRKLRHPLRPSEPMEVGAQHTDLSDARCSLAPRIRAAQVRLTIKARCSVRAYAMTLSKFAPQFSEITRIGMDLQVCPVLTQCLVL